MKITKIREVTLVGNEKVRVPGGGVLGPINADKDHDLLLELDQERRCVIVAGNVGDSEAFEAILIPMECIASIRVSVERPKQQGKKAA